MKLSLPILATVVACVLAKKKSKNEFEPKFSTISPDLTEIEAAAATAVSNQYTSAKIPGCVFDNYYQIWLENTDYEKAFNQDDLAWLRTQGITLDNYWSLTHPSEPNYVGVVGGDYFGINNDNFFRVPSNVSTVVDLLESRGISWSEYQEHQPYTGFEGFNFSRQSDYAKDYVRKHNPLVIYDSVVDNENRLGNLKNFSEFDRDLQAKRLPQWTFITPNMTNDAHDTDIDFAGRWVNRWLKPLLSNEEFMKNSLVILTFDENHTKPLENKVLAILFGGAVPDHLKGTTDSNYYSHYSNLATVQANWGLDHLGRFDAVANPFKVVADPLNISLVDVDTTGQYNNKSVAGYFNDYHVPIPTPNASVVGVVGNTIFPPIAKLWGVDREVPSVVKGQCGKPAASAKTNETVAEPAETAKIDAKPGFNGTVAVINSTVPESSTVAIAGTYVTVYTSDCVTTSVDETGNVVTVHVPQTVTSTVCPKCEHSEVVASVPVSVSAASVTVTKILSTVQTTVSKPVESVETLKSEAPEAESPKSEAPKAETPASAVSSPKAEGSASKPVEAPAKSTKTPASAPKVSSPASKLAASPTPLTAIPVAQPTQAQQPPAAAQANAADKRAPAFLPLALLPLLPLF